MLIGVAAPYLEVPRCTARRGGPLEDARARGITDNERGPERDANTGDMRRLRAKLPSANALVVFEAAGRHLSFTRAAAEMRITQAAVSRQIRALEERLGTRLFDRSHRALRLTAQGRRLHQAVTLGLEHIARAFEELQGPDAGRQLTVATTLAFASFWLMPRIPRFRSTHPDIDVRVVASDREVDPGAEDVDAVVRYGRQRWPGFDALTLLDEEVFPVCSPGYLAGRPGIGTPADLRDETLLHLDEEDPSWIGWDAWLERMGVGSPPLKRGLRVSNYPMLVQAAVDGQGVALGWRHLVDELIARGALVRPMAVSLRTDEAFHLHVPAEGALEAETAAFRDWILGEAG